MLTAMNYRQEENCYKKIIGSMQSNRFTPGNERKIGKFFKNKWKVKEFLIYSLDTTRSLDSRWALKGMVAIQVNLKENFVLIQK